jgi:hypothetical protein
MFSERADLANYISSCSDRLIVFDGRCQAGKTTIMTAMSKELRLPAIDGDKFLVPEFGRRRPFIETLQLDELKAEIEQALRLSDVVLLATVCARQVVNMAGLPKATFIYVERTSSTLLEVHKRDFDDDFDAPNPDGSEHPLHWEVEDYHRSEYAPRTLADAVYFSVRE